MKPFFRNRVVISVVTLFAFICFMELTQVDLSAMNAPAQVQTPGTGAVEQAGGGSSSGGSSIVPILLIVLAAAAIAAVLILVVFKTKYDITGAWTLNFHWSTNSGTTTITFTGDKESGTFTSGSSSGTYTVDGKNVVWTFTNGTKYTGTFSDKTNMSGTMVSYTGSTGTWEAVKKTTTDSGNPPAAITKGADCSGEIK